MKHFWRDGLTPRSSCNRIGTMENEYKDCLDAIEKILDKITFYFPKSEGIHIGLPYPFVAPSGKRTLFENDQFYWDSYFIILGLTESGHIELAKGMIENLAYLYRRFGIIPSRNRYYNLGISQPPFFTSMALEVFHCTKDMEWLKEMVKVGEGELQNYWTNKVHKAYKGLSRYCDHWNTHLTSEHEAGWDMTSRFQNRCLDFLPVDLNTLLYKYEIDLVDIYKILGKTGKTEKYLTLAEKRKTLINKLMWNEEKGFYFDYNYRKKSQSGFFSLAGFYPLWAGVATKEQAKKMLSNIRIFEYEGGLANTQKEGLSEEFKQWDYPNGWPNQQWIVIKGLWNYGYREEAKRLAKKWLDTNKGAYEKCGTFWEKYNVVKKGKAKCGRYPTQKGFGWTNGVFIKLVKLLELK